MPVSDGRLKRQCAMDVLMRRALAVRAAGAAGLGTSPQRLVDDGLDGARASAAFGAAAEAAVDLLGVAGKVLRRLDGTADIVVAKDVTRTHNHKNGRPIGEVEPFDIEVAGTMQKEKPHFEVIPN
jgi:hypothetical protein